MAHWIRFVCVERVDPKRKTEQWHVISNSAIAVLLGQVGWYGRWRKYSFFPNRGNDLVFEQDCLRDIAEFCETQTKNYRARKAGANGRAKTDSAKTD